MPTDSAASLSPVMPLTGRRALVTGGGRGIGRAIAAALTAQGADVTVLGRSAAALDATVAAGDAVRAIACDVTDRAALATAIASAGDLDILVNNAGHAETASIRRMEAALFDRMIALNLTAVFDGIHAVLPGMVARGSGRIVSVASTAGLTGYPYVSAYCAAKHGVVGLTRALAREVATSGVTVNCVCPGFTETDLVAGSVDTIVAKTGRTAEAALADLTKSMPIGRLIKPQEVAGAVLWLVSDQAAAVTGIALPVAGGEI
ncbi:MAG: SDR family NAD(P)-dependent oxidoreductase [Phreatobacter sp.]|uniref:SDR family oxidoreductase n=1 Tax=Phreatobacter sp. TaxID=1966341 RepID=UPI002735BBC3|nr:SDR family NAD(P)-dependent oxidoreductase [Phreatobacter sp.]MDP2800871.1 SDR family NAD(P)-dependent oxidoreductase [Phreatobacter sp.]